MAISTNGKRSVRSNINIAAGDTAAPISKTVNVMMAERESQCTARSDSSPLTNLLASKDIIALTAVSLAVYLINGTYAETICTTLTSVPPAIFSYRVLINTKTSKEGYHSILFYWTLYGILTVIDQFLAGTQGYNFLKSCLLMMLFWHAVRTNPTSIPTSWKIIEFSSKDFVQSILTMYDSQGFAKTENSSHFVPKTPTITHFSDDDASEYMIPSNDYELNEKAAPKYNLGFLDMTTACSFMPSLEMQTTQKATPNEVRAECGKDGTPVMRLEQAGDYADDDGGVKLKVKYESEHFRPHSTTLPERQFLSMSAMTCNANGQSDIITIPHDKIQFSPYHMESVIKVTNISNLHLMFALKTNADTYLVAAPTTGLIKSGETMAIRVAVTESFFRSTPNPEKFIDKVAIDYSLIPQSQSPQPDQFSFQFFANHNRRRHAIRVYYG